MLFPRWEHQQRVAYVRSAGTRVHGFPALFSSENELRRVKGAETTEDFLYSLRCWAVVSLAHYIRSSNLFRCTKYFLTRHQVPYFWHSQTSGPNPTATCVQGLTVGPNIRSTKQDTILFIELPVAAWLLYFIYGHRT